MTKQKFFDRFIAVFATGVPEKQIQRHVYDTKEYNNYALYGFQILKSLSPGRNTDTDGRTECL